MNLYLKFDECSVKYLNPEFSSPSWWNVIHLNLEEKIGFEPAYSCQGLPCQKDEQERIVESFDL